MNFQEAEARFQWLENQRRAGLMSEEQYHTALNELRVTDPWGRLWMPQEHTGQWHLYQNGQWIPATPPVVPPPPPQAAPVAPPPQAQGRPQAQPQPQPHPTPAGQRSFQPQPKQDSVGCLKPILSLIGLGIFWSIIAVIVYLIWGREEPMVVLGVGLAALLSLILVLLTMAKSWKGQIVEVKTERVRVDDGDNDWHWENQTFAYIRLTNGRTRKERLARGWQVGDRLEKRRGEMQIRKL